jgi:hypothetical protein
VWPRVRFEDGTERALGFSTQPSKYPPAIARARDSPLTEFAPGREGHRLRGRGHRIVESATERLKEERCAILTRLLARNQIFNQHLVRFSWRGELNNPILEIFMPLTVVLAVGLDSSLLARESSDWKSAGYVFTSTGSIREAIGHCRYGDFDLILLGHAIPPDSRERLTFLIRASGSRTPVVCVADPSSDSDSFADATIRNGPISLLQGIRELLAERAKPHMPSQARPGIAA